MCIFVFRHARERERENYEAAGTNEDEMKRWQSLYHRWSEKEAVFEPNQSAHNFPGPRAPSWLFYIWIFLYYTKTRSPRRIQPSAIRFFCYATIFPIFIIFCIFASFFQIYESKIFCCFRRTKKMSTGASHLRSQSVRCLVHEKKSFRHFRKTFAVLTLRKRKQQLLQQVIRRALSWPKTRKWFYCVERTSSKCAGELFIGCRIFGMQHLSVITKRNYIRLANYCQCRKSINFGR